MSAPLQRGDHSKNLVLFEYVGWLFESYFVLFDVIWCDLKVFCHILKKFKAEATCFLHKPACNE